MALNSTHLAASSHALHRKRFGNDLFMFYSCIRKVGAERCSQGVVFLFFICDTLFIIILLIRWDEAYLYTNRESNFFFFTLLNVGHLFLPKKLKGVSQSVTTVTSNLWQVYTWPLLSLKNKCPDFDMTESQSLPLRDIFLYRTSFAMKGVHVHAFGLTVS